MPCRTSAPIESRSRCEDHALIGGQIQFDAREGVRRRHGPAIAELALAGEIAARVPEDLEVLFIGGDLDTGLVVDPLADLAEHPLQEGRVELGLVAQGEVEVL